MNTSASTGPSAADCAAANAEVIGSAYASFAAGDVPAVLGALADDVTWHVPGRHPLSGDYAGGDEVLAFLQNLLERSEGTFRLVIGDLLSGGDHVVALVTELASRQGKELAGSSVHVWEVRERKVASFVAFHGDDHAVDAFWA
jgi:ketosteroid isomerase-like protein